MTSANSDRRTALEFVAALLLGVGGLLTAYAANEGATAAGTATIGYTESTRLTTSASQFGARETQRYLADQAVWLEYQLLLGRGEADLAAQLRSAGFGPDLSDLVDRWEAVPEAERPVSPFDLDDGYSSPSGRIAVELFEQSQQVFDEARGVGERSGSFGTASVVLAVTLLLAGVATLLRTRRLQVACLAGSALMIAPAVVLIGRGKAWW